MRTTNPRIDSGVVDSYNKYVNNKIIKKLIKSVEKLILNVNITIK